MRSKLGIPSSSQPGVGGVSHKRVREGINRVWNLAPAENQFRPNQLAKRLLQPLYRQLGYGVQQFVGRGQRPYYRNQLGRGHDCLRNAGSLQGAGALRRADNMIVLFTDFVH